MIGRARDDTSPKRCEACRATNTERHHTAVQGIEMELCVNPTECRRRWQATAEASR